MHGIYGLSLGYKSIIHGLWHFLLFNTVLLWYSFIINVGSSLKLTCHQIVLSSQIGHRLFDTSQNIDQPAYAFALRVVPATADLYQAWRLNSIVTAPTREGINNVKVDPSFELKYKQGEASNNVVGRRLNYIFGTDDRQLVSSTSSYPWSVPITISWFFKATFSCMQLITLLTTMYFG